MPCDNYVSSLSHLWRQVAHKKTFFFLEQLMIKHRAHSKTIKVKTRTGEALLPCLLLKID